MKVYLTLAEVGERLQDPVIGVTIYRWWQRYPSTHETNPFPEAKVQVGSGNKIVYGWLPSQLPAIERFRKRMPGKGNGVRGAGSNAE